MAKKLTPETIEAAAQHLENIQSGKTPILKGSGSKDEPDNKVITLGKRKNIKFIL